jgi:hypothetical protein
MINVTVLTCSRNALMLSGHRYCYVVRRLIIFSPIYVFIKRNDFITHRLLRVKHNVMMFIFFQELNTQKQEMMQLEHERGIRNNLLEYLRSFDPDVVMTHLLLNLYQLSVVK